MNSQRAVARFVEPRESDLEPDEEHEEQLPDFREPRDDLALRLDDPEHIRPEQTPDEDEPPAAQTCDEWGSRV